MFDPYSETSNHARQVANQHPKTLTTWQDAVRQNRDMDVDLRLANSSGQNLRRSLAGLLKPMIVLTIAVILVILTASGCTPSQPQPTTIPVPALPQGSPPIPTSANMPNPASAYCEEQGNRLEIRTAADGSQSGVCIFPNGGECDEWAYFRGECAPSTPTAEPTEEILDGWKVYRDERMGFSFQYPANATIDSESDRYTVFVTGPVVDNNSWPVLGISYPTDRSDYHVPAGTDLRRWLIEHNLYTDQPQPDVTIAGTPAIHTRFAGGAQSFAQDRYYFVHSEQMFVITILHTGREDWDLYNRFLQSFQFQGSEAGSYQGWWTYTHLFYGFSIMLPEDWVVEEITTFDPQMSGHTLTLRPEDLAPGIPEKRESILMMFRRVGEDARLWPTGVGAAECIQQDTLEIAGQSARRMLLICPNGDITAIWYHGPEEGQPNIVVRGELEFGFIFRATSSHCEAGYTLEGKTQRLGEMIIASLRVP